MFYVYVRWIKSGREEFINTYNSEIDAIKKIAQNYKIDGELGDLGEHYYFYKKH